MTTPTAAAETDMPAEWADVARRKYAHYKALCDEYERKGDWSDPSAAISVHQRSLAEMVPHLVDAIDTLTAEAARVSQWKADVLREAAHELETRYPENVWLPDSDSPDAQAAKGVRVACKQLRHMADEAEVDR